MKHNTKGALSHYRNNQISEGACCGELYVSGNAHHSARIEKCNHREECDLYKKFKELIYHYQVCDYMSKLTPRIWRKCEPVKEGGKK